MSKSGLVKIVCLIGVLLIGSACFAEMAEGTVVEGCYCYIDEEKYNEALYTDCNTKMLELIAKLMKDVLEDYEVEDGYGLYFSNYDIDLYYMEENHYENNIGVCKSIIKRFCEYSRVVIEKDSYMYYFLQIDKDVWLYVIADL